MTRILHVVPSLALRTGGPAINVTNLAFILQSRGHEVSIFSTDAATSAQADQARGGVTVEELPRNVAELDLKLFSLRHPYRLAFCPSLGRELARTVSSYDVVHIHSLNLYPQFAAWRSATRVDIPYVVSPRGALDPWILGRGKFRKRIVNSLWQRRMLNGAAALHLTTEEEQRLIEPLGLSAPTVVIPNGIDLTPYNELPARHEFRNRFLGGFAGPLVLNHGRVDDKKGLDILVAAIARARADLPDVRLVLVGPDDNRVGDALVAQAAALGIGDAVHFIGPLFDRELRGALASADVWALPSHGENFGIAVAEAMAACLPVVVSPNVNLAPEASLHGALKIAENEPEAFALAILELLQDNTAANHLAGQGRQYVQRWDWTRVVDDYVSLYCEARNNNSWPRR